MPLLFVSCGGAQNTDQVVAEPKTGNAVTLTDAQYKNAGIETGALSRRNISSLLKVNGKIDVPPQSMVSISVPLGGYLKSSSLLPGMQVKKGQVLAVIEGTQYIQLQQDYLTAKSQLGFLESEYKRQGELNRSKATSDKVFEQTRANYQAQQVLTKSLEQKLQLIRLNPGSITANNISRSINIYAPINGFVSAVNVNIGKYVDPSEVLFELVDPGDIHLSLSVFEKDVNRLAVGKKLFAYTNSDPAKKYPCRIILIGQNLSEQNAVEVHCHIDQYDKTLLPGMYMNAEIEVEGNAAMALPEDAIVRFGNKQYVFIVDGSNRFAMQEVQPGNTEGGFTEILDADALKDRTIVTRGAYNLLMTFKNRNEE